MNQKVIMFLLFLEVLRKPQTSWKTSLEYQWFQRRVASVKKKSYLKPKGPPKGLLLAHEKQFSTTQTWTHSQWLSQLSPWTWACSFERCPWSEFQPLCTCAWLDLGDRVLGEVGRNNFIALPGKGGHSRLMPSRLCPTLEGLVRSLLVLKEQGVVSSWTFFWLVGGKASGNQHHQFFGPNGLRSTCLWAAES